MKSLVLAVGVSCAFASTLAAPSAYAASVDVEVFASADSWNNGAPLAGGGSTGIFFEIGQEFKIVTDPADTWSLDGSSQQNASGSPVIYGIGLFGWPWGTMIGRVGSGSVFRVDFAYEGTAGEAGELLLYLLDTDSFNNAGSILATVTYEDSAAVPLPMPAMLLLGGIAMLAGTKRRS